MKKNILFLLVVAAVLLTITACKQNSVTETVVTLTTDNFTEETERGVVMIDFWATWCMPCKAMTPVIDEIAAQTLGKVKVGKVDIDANGSLANKFGIQSIPAIIILKDGKIVKTFNGLQSKAALVDELSKHVALE